MIISDIKRLHSILANPATKLNVASDSCRKKLVKLIAKLIPLATDIEAAEKHLFDVLAPQELKDMVERMKSGEQVSKEEFDEMYLAKAGDYEKAIKDLIEEDREFVAESLTYEEAEEFISLNNYHLNGADVAFLFKTIAFSS